MPEPATHHTQMICQPNTDLQIATVLTPTDAKRTKVYRLLLIDPSSFGKSLLFVFY